MSNTSSLEVFRAVYMDNQSPFFEEATSFKRAIFDRNGNGAYAMRSDNQVHPTKKSGARLYSEDDLFYYHTSVASLNKHMVSKMLRARQRLQEGTPPNQAREASNPLLQLSLEDAMRAVQTAEFGQDAEDLIDLTLDKVDFTEYPILHPGKVLFTLEATDKRSPNFKLLSRLNEVAREALVQTRAFDRMAEAPVVARIPFAETKTHDPLKLAAFAEHIAELLPLPVQISPTLEFRTTY